jgi:hypothetical protein
MIKQDNSELIKKFQDFIFSHDFTLNQVGVLLKLSPAGIYKILSGKAKHPHPRTLYKIKKLLGETVGSTSNPKRGGVASQD